MDPRTLDEVIELLDDKIVRTPNGSFISVEDLRGLVKERAELRQEQRQMPKHKTMHAARHAAMADAKLREMFEPSPRMSPDPPNPAVVKERTQSATSA